MTKKQIPSAQPIPLARLLAVGAVTAVLSSATYAQEEEYSLSFSAGASYSDNIRRDSANEVSDTSAQAGLKLNLIQEKRRVSANVAADLEYLTYLDNTYDDELRGGLDGTVNFAFVPDRLSWTVQDNLFQSFIDPGQVDTADNRQATNYLTTGPNISLPLGSRTDLGIEARWSDVSYETSKLDSQRYSGAVRLSRLLGENTSLSLNGTAERVEYQESPPLSNYDGQSAYIMLVAQGGKTDLTVRGGYTAIHDYGDTTDGFLGEVSITRIVSARSTLTLDAGTDLSDAAEVYRREQRVTGVSVDSENSIPSSDVFQADYVTLAWMLEQERGSAQISVNWRQEDHEVEIDLNRESTSLNLALHRDLSARLSASFNAGFVSDDYKTDELADYEEWSVGVGVNWHFTPHLSLMVGADHFDSRGTGAGTNQRDYEENRLNVRFQYAPRS